MQSLDPFLLYGMLCFISFVENIFPPSPSDMVVVFGGSLVGLGVIDFVPALLWTTLGSTIGFVTVYKIGDWFGIQIIEKYRPKFFPIEAIHKVEEWFRRYGYWIIVANRFLAGTRAVVAFFSGLSELNFPRTTALSTVSALVWNFALLLGGYMLGKNWERIGSYLGTYSEVVTGIVLLAVLVAAGRVLWMRSKKRKPR